MQNQQANKWYFFYGFVVALCLLILFFGARMLWSNGWAFRGIESVETPTYEQMMACTTKNDCTEISNPKSCTCGLKNVVVSKRYKDEYRAYIKNQEKNNPDASCICSAVIIPDPIGLDCVNNKCRHVFPE